VSNSPKEIKESNFIRGFINIGPNWPISILPKPVVLHVRHAKYTAAKFWLKQISFEVLRDGPFIKRKGSNFEFSSKSTGEIM